MGQVLIAAISPSNIALTVLLGLIMLYWLSVILGALDLDSLDVDFDIDADVDVDADLNTEIAGAESGAGQGFSGFFVGILRFFNFGRLPFMMILSILFLTMWSISILCNHEGSWFNPTDDITWAAIWLGPNFILSLFITKAATAPLVPIFAKLDSSKKPFEYEGRTGQLTLGASETEVGQLRLEIENSVIVLRVLSLDGAVEKGEEVMIVEYLPEQDRYLVQKI